MSGYIDLPIDTDPQDILDDFTNYMQTIIPGWTLAPGNLDTWIAMAVSLAAAETRDVASDVPKDIFRWFGANLINFPPTDASAATVLTDWTMINNAGYTIPAGTQVSIGATGDLVYAFETQADVVIAPGSTLATGVQIVAVTPGADSSALGSLGSAVQLIDPLTYVASITQQTATSGGVDAEEDEAYLSRLAEYLQLLAPRPIIPDDFAVFSRNNAGVQRATAIDGYDPVTASFNNARTVAVALVDANGTAVSSAVKADVRADLSARREVNFVVNVIDPTINLIDVTYQVKALAGFDLATLVLSINAALGAYLDPSTWGSTNGFDWKNVSVVRYLEIAQVINAVPGVDYITTTSSNYDLTIALHGNSLARADVALTGVAPLAFSAVLTGVAI